jgi:hypothetical protein
MTRHPSTVKKTVWVPSTVDKDLASARQYGDVQAIVLSYVPESQGCEQISAKLTEDSIPGDYLVMAGNPVYQAYAFRTLLDLHKSVNCLVWDRKLCGYRLVTITA